MKKIISILYFIFFILMLSSCGNVNNISNIKSVYFYETCVDDCSTFTFSKNKNGMKEILDEANKIEYQEAKGNKGQIIDDSENISKFAAYDAVLSSNKFDIYVMIETIPNDVKRVKLEVDNDIKINNIDCTKNNSYDIDVTGTKSYFTLSIEMKSNTVIKFISISDNDNSYRMANSINGYKRANELELISAIDFVTFDDEYNSFVINETTNIEFKSISFGGKNYTELDSVYSFNDYSYFNIKYVYKIKDTELKCDRTYEKRNDGIYHIGSGSETIIYEYK